MADKALEPEFNPEVGKLYMFAHGDSPNAFTLDMLREFNGREYLGTYTYWWDICRPLTKQEWITLGAPVSNKSESQLVITEAEAILLERVIPFKNLDPDIEDIIERLLNGAKVA